MTCPRHNDLSAYADDQLKPAERARFSRHLQACPSCQRRLEALNALHRSLRTLPSPTLGFDLASRLEDRLQAKPRRVRPVSRSSWPWSGWVPAGLVAGMALASGVWLGSLLVGGAVNAPHTTMARVFDPVPPGGLCAAAELCHVSKGRP